MDAHARAYVASFMSAHGAAPTYELEARIRGGVAPVVFARVLRRLQGAGAGVWAFTSVEESLDVTFPCRTRTTHTAAAAAPAAPAAPPPPPTHLRKRRLADPQDLELRDPATGVLVPVRVSCAEEQPVAAPLGGAAAQPELFRLKRRHSFNRRHELQYDLTEVRAGPTLALARAAPPPFEVEVEWRGQDAAARGAYDGGDGVGGGGGGGTALMTEKFMCKLADLVGLVAQSMME